MRTKQAYMPPEDGSEGVRIVEIPDDSPIYIPAKLVFDRLKAKGKFMAAWNLLTEEQRIEVTLLQQGFDQADPQVRGLITIVGEDPDEILAEEA
jgi:hypothetical protein